MSPITRTTLVHPDAHGRARALALAPRHRQADPHAAVGLASILIIIIFVFILPNPRGRHLHRQCDRPHRDLLPQHRHLANTVQPAETGQEGATRPRAGVPANTRRSSEDRRDRGSAPRRWRTSCVPGWSSRCTTAHVARTVPRAQSSPRRNRRHRLKPLQAVAMPQVGLDLDGPLLALAAASHSGGAGADFDGVGGASWRRPLASMHPTSRSTRAAAGGAADRPPVRLEPLRQARRRCSTAASPVGTRRPAAQAVCNWWCGRRSRTDRGVPFVHTAVDGCGAPSSRRRLARAFARIAIASPDTAERAALRARIRGGGWRAPGATSRPAGCRRAGAGGEGRRGGRVRRGAPGRASIDGVAAAGTGGGRGGVALAMGGAELAAAGHRSACSGTGFRWGRLCPGASRRRSDGLPVQNRDVHTGERLGGRGCRGVDGSGCGPAGHRPGAHGGPPARAAPAGARRALVAGLVRGAADALRPAAVILPRGVRPCRPHGRARHAAVTDANIAHYGYHARAAVLVDESAGTRRTRRTRFSGHPATVAAVGLRPGRNPSLPRCS